MIVFIGWSKDRSKVIASALYDFLQNVLQKVHPWMSEEDIRSGNTWETEVSSQLDQANFGIIALTRENQHEPWIQFEAGALSKKVGQSAVCPYLIDIAQVSEVTGPLTKFQMRKADPEGTLALIKDINRTLLAEALPEERLTNIFNKFWPDLQKVIETNPTSPEGGSTRNERDLLEEILETVRSLERQATEASKPSLPLGPGYEPSLAAEPRFAMPPIVNSPLHQSASTAFSTASGSTATNGLQPTTRYIKQLAYGLALMDKQSREAILAAVGSLTKAAEENDGEDDRQS